MPCAICGQPTHSWAETTDDMLDWIRRGGRAFHCRCNQRELQRKSSYPVIC